MRTAWLREKWLSALQGFPMLGFGVPIRCKDGTVIVNLSSQLHQRGAAETASNPVGRARVNPFV
jgi:hypothetical protein